MNVSFRHANPGGGHESSALYFEDPVADRTEVVLVDAGRGVDVDELLDDGERLSAALLTHAHLDHYEALADNLRDGAPVYATPTTAAVLEDVLAEAERNHDVGDTGAVVDAVEPIDGWTAVAEGVQVTPIPAGHVPGAASFLVRFEDAGRARTILITGDFTHRRAAGHPGLPSTVPVDVDAVFLTGATETGVESALTESVAAILERARHGSPVLATAGGLRGVRYAYLLGHVAAELSEPLPITLVGQAAKLYETLGYDVPGVEPVPVFDDPDALLAPGEVTIAGPESPVEGSARRLFSAIEDDAAATLVQVGNGSVRQVESARCTVESFAFGNHPERERIDALVDELDPIQVVIKHQRGRALNEFREAYDDSFVWATTDEDRFELYRSGNWAAPPWMSERGARHVYSRHRDAGGESDDREVELPPVGWHAEVDLAAEGLDVDRIADRLRVPRAGSDERGRSGGERSPASDGGAAPAVSGTDGAGADADGGDGGADDSAPPVAATTAESNAQAVERRSGEAVTLEDVYERVAAIERSIAASPAGTEIEARVVDAGDGVVLLRPDDAAALSDLEHGETVSVELRRDGA